MKIVVPFLLLIFVFQAWASCKPKTIRVWSKESGYSCVQRFQSDNPAKDCVTCQDGCDEKHQSFDKWLSNFPSVLYQPNDLPWWAQQGNLYYPNLHYPGAWNNKKKNPGINADYYPGTGEIHALKPNIYIESIHQEKKFTFSFTSKEELSFLESSLFLVEI